MIYGKRFDLDHFDVGVSGRERVGPRHRDGPRGMTRRPPSKAALAMVVSTEPLIEREFLRLLSIPVDDI